MTHLQPHTDGRPGARWNRRSAPITVRSFVLLAGGVRATSLQALVGRSVLNLPLSESLRVLDVWRKRIGELLTDSLVLFPQPDVRILAGSSSALPSSVEDSGELRVVAVRDTTRYRGTAGVLRDLGEQFEPDEFLLIGTASQCPDEDQIRDLVRYSDPTDGVTLSAGPDGSPTGLMLIRCGALADVPGLGYVDLKEQALPRIAEKSGVRVLEVGGPAARPMRTAKNYLNAVRSWHASRSLRGSSSNPYEERWKPVFSIVEPGAHVGQGTRLHDSIVLAGGIVEPGSVVVRSVVGPGGRVRARRPVLDELVLRREVARRVRGKRARKGAQ